MKEFNIDNWNGLLLGTSDSYRQLKDYVENEEAKEKHLHSISITHINSDKSASIKSTVAEYKNEALNTYLLNQIDRAFFHYSNQMIVLLASYLEIIIKEYFEILFYYYPDKMYKYLCTDQNDKQKKTIDIQEALNFDSIEELKIKIADESATKASKGKIKVVLNRINIICGNIINKNLIEKFDRLVDKRNKIVHELDLTEILDKEIYGNRECLFELLKVLGTYLKSNNILIIDKGGIVSK